MTILLGLVLLGLLAGALSGLVGIGGGIIMVPVLVLLFGLSQHQAQGTTLAVLVLPVGILGAWTYYRHGYVDLKMAAAICLGFLIGSLFGARLATDLPGLVLQKVFGVALLLVALRMIFAR